MKTLSAFNWKWINPFWKKWLTKVSSLLVSRSVLSFIGVEWVATRLLVHGHISGDNWTNVTMTLITVVIAKFGHDNYVSAKIEHEEAEKDSE